jgi:hypothetical protein
VRAAAVLLVASLGLAGGVHAEEPGTSSSIADQLRDEQQRRARRWVGAARARITYPQKVSVGLGFLTAKMPADYACDSVCQYRGLILEVEPGVAGGQVSMGYARVVAESRGNPAFLTDVYVGWGVRGAVLRTWGDSPLTPEDQTLVGIEGQFTIARVGFSLGVFYRVSPEAGSNSTRITGGIGWGF